MTNRSNMIPIAGRLHCVAEGEPVCGADEIYDDNLGVTLDKLSVKPATSGTTGDNPYDGMGRVVLVKNMVSDVNTLTQDMLYKGATGSRVPNTNTIFVIQYDFTLGEDITVPANCALEFEGGSVANSSGNSYTLTGRGTKVVTDDYSQIFDSVTLDGTFDVTHFSICHWGVKTGSGNASANTTILNTYIVSSMQTLGNTLVVPFDTEHYYINDTITLDYSFDLICDGIIHYAGTDVNTALVIGNASRRFYNKTFRIKIIRDQITYSGETIPESVGVKMINLKDCTVYLDLIRGFAYSAKVQGISNGFTNNKVYICDFGESQYRVGLALEVLKADSEAELGWVNENDFFGGNFNPKLGSTNLNNSTAILFTGEDVNDKPINNNRFYSPNFEGATIAIKTDRYARDNMFISPRFEGVGSCMMINDSYSKNNIVLGGYYSDSAVLPNINGNGLFRDEELYNLKGNVIFDDAIRQYVLSGNSKKASSVLLLDSTDANKPIVIETSNTLGYYGLILDVSVYKSFKIETNVNSRRIVSVLDPNTNLTIALSQAIGYYIKNNRTYLIPSKGTTLQDGGERKVGYLTFTENVSLVFISLLSTSNVDCLKITSLDGGFAKDIIQYPATLKNFSSLPSSTTNAKVGDQIFISSKPYWWNGSAWVDATGATV